MCNMERIPLTASEEMSFENVDGRTEDGRTPDACIYYKLTCELIKNLGGGGRGTGQVEGGSGWM